MTKKTQRNVLIRTITHYYVGTAVAENDRWITLDNASWIADTGRFSAVFEKGFDNNAEIERLPDGTQINVQNIIDVIPFSQTLPTKTQ